LQRGTAAPSAPRERRKGADTLQWVCRTVAGELFS
jgi:hypothetical protein